MGDAAGQDGEGCTLLFHRKRKLMGDAASQNGEDYLLLSYRQRRAMGWRAGGSWWAGSLPLSMKPASIYPPNALPALRFCYLMAKAVRCDD